MNGDKERFNGCKAFQRILDGEFLTTFHNYSNVLFQRSENGAKNTPIIAIVNGQIRRKIAGLQDFGKE